MQLVTRPSKQTLAALCLGAVIAAFFAFPALASAAFGVSGFQLAPSSKQAAGHPTLTFKFSRNGTLNEDLRDVVVEYPEGQLFNPESVPTKCTDAQFNADQCSTDSYVGSINLAVQKQWYWNPTYSVRGSVYVLEASGSDHAVLGYVLRPPSAFAPKVFLKQVVNLTADSTGPVTTTRNNARTQSWWFPQVMGTWNIAVKSVTVSYNARSNPWRTGPSFVLNPSACSNKVAKLTATSYQDVVSTASFSWTPTGCSNVPFNPSVAIDVDNHDGSAGTGATVSIDVPTTDRSVQNSTVKNAQISLNGGVGLDATLLQSVNGGVGCSEADLATDDCPAATRIGGGSSSMPFYPPSFSGDLYLVDGSGAPAKLALVLHGPRGLRSIVRAELGASGAGSSSSVLLSLTDVPPIPLGDLVLDLDAPAIINPSACPQNVAVTAAVNASSGQAATHNLGYAVDCPPEPPETTIDSAPSGLVGGADQTFTFSSDVSGSGFECEIDGGGDGPWSACASPHTSTFTDGTHSFRVRAVAGGLPDPTPAQAVFTTDATDPAVSISSPTEGQVLAGTSTMQGIGTGGASSCAIDVAGGLLCWGWNASGQLGDGTTSDHSAPVAVPSLASGVVQVEGGQRHKCALLDDGTVKCWGWNSWGQVGDGTTVDKLTPTTVPGLTNVVKISAGDYHTCAVRDDGILHCWGRYTFGGASSSTPVAIAGIGNATDVKAGSSFTCALLSDGGVKCFGENGYGELGTGSWSYGSAAPVSVTGISDAVKLAAGASHSCVVTSAGSVKCWGWNGGYNGHYILGNGSTDDYSATPTQVLGVTSGAADVALGAVHSCARMVDGTVLCWGSNGHGQRGYPGATSATPPTVASGLSGVLELKSGTNHLCARTATGVKCWGYNIYGQIGDGTTISRNLPTSVVGLDSLTGMTPLTYSVVEANPGTVECSLDGGAFAPCPSGIDTSALADGSYTLTVRAVDQVGNAGEATVNFIVDKTAPVVTIDSPDPLVTYNGDPVPLSFSVTEANPGTTTCSIDGGTPGACPASVDLDSGFHTVQVSHIDAAGNAGSATAQYLVQLEVPPPVIISPSGVTGDDTPVLVFSLAAPGGTTLCVVDDGEAFLCASGDDLGPLSDGPHTISVTVITDEGDVGTAVQVFTVDTSSPVDTQISVGPEGGLAITDPTPEWEFISDDPSATFECSVDSGAWSSCSSPFTAPSFDTGDGQGGSPNGKIDADETGAHTFEARAVVAGTPDSTPDTAAFTLAEFAPQFSVELADPSDPSDLDGNDATANPDVKLTATNLVGDPGTAALTTPDHMWLAQAAVPACSTTDAGAGDCLEASRIGDVAFTFMVNREPHDSIAGLHSLTVTGAVYLTQRWAAGESMGAVAEFDVVDSDGRNYGKVNQRIHLTLDHLSTDDASTAAVEENTSVSNPPRVTVSAEPLPGKTPLAVDGAMLELHQVGSELELWGSRSHYDRPLTHNSADCTSTPSPEAGTPVQWAYRVADGSASDPVELTQSYSVDNCDQVPFSLNVDELRFENVVDSSQSSDDSLNPPPRLVDFDGDLIPETATPLATQMRFSIPPGGSTMRTFSVDLPASVKQRIGGFYTSLCAGTDTKVNVDRDLDSDGTIDKHDYVACDLDNSMVGNIEITSPLFETVQYGELFIEDEVYSALPSIYAVIRNEDLGLNLRLRARTDILTGSGGYGFLRLSLNFAQWPPSSSLPSIPITNIALTLPGTNMNGPIFEVNSACHDQDAATVNALGWSDSDADGDRKTVTTMGPKSYFGNSDSPCLPVDTDLVDNPADADPGASPTAGDTTTDGTPSWIANREYTNTSGTVRYVWFECSTDRATDRACGDFTPVQDKVVRVIRSGPAPTGTSCFYLVVDGESTVCIARYATNYAVQAALESLPSITPGCVTVSGAPPSSALNSFLITFLASCYLDGNFPNMGVTLGVMWTPADSTLAIQTVTVGAAGTWITQPELVPAGATVTHSRVVAPQPAQLPLSAGDGHKFAVRLKSSATFPSLATANSGSAVGLETYSSPYPLSPSIETPFMVAP